MVTRSEQNRLDAQEEQIQKLHADMAEVKSTLQSVESDHVEQAEFRKFIMNWVKHQDKRKMDDEGEGSGLFEKEGDSGFTDQKMNFPFKENDKSAAGHLPWATKKVKLPEFSGFIIP